LNWIVLVKVVLRFVGAVISTKSDVLHLRYCSKRSRQNLTVVGPVTRSVILILWRIKGNKMGGVYKNTNLL
jgi:hypothetical protein